MCVRKEQSLLFDLFKAFDSIERYHIYCRKTILFELPCSYKNHGPDQRKSFYQMADRISFWPPTLWITLIPYYSHINVPNPVYTEYKKPILLPLFEKGTVYFHDTVLLIIFIHFGNYIQIS